MALPDLSGLTTDELAQTIALAKAERLRRNVLDDLDEQIRSSLQEAKDQGVPRTKVVAYLTNVVNEIYPTP